jgi:hypothetical protein
MLALLLVLSRLPLSPPRFLICISSYLFEASPFSFSSRLRLALLACSRFCCEFHTSTPLQFAARDTRHLSAKPHCLRELLAFDA